MVSGSPSREHYFGTCGSSTRQAISFKDPSFARMPTHAIRLHEMGTVAIGCLKSGDAVEADRLWKVAGLAEAGEGAVLLVDGEDADVSGLRVDGVDEFSGGADGDVYIMAAGGVVAEDCAGDGSEGAVFADVEAGDVVAAGVGDVDPCSVRR